MLLDNNETGIFNLFWEEFESGQMSKTRIPLVADIRDRIRLEEIFEKYKPEIVFHAAAYKHVPLMELCPEEAIKTNIQGTKNLIESSQKYNIEKFIFISSDKAVKPVSIMGITKQEGEKICQEADYISVRFGNVLTSRGSVIPTWQEQMKRGNTITITHPAMKRYFMTLFEACELVIESAKIGKGREIFVLDMGKPIKITDMANQMIRLSGKDIKIKYIGVRPGEKMFEELYDKDTEKLIKTSHKKIWQVIKK